MTSTTVDGESEASVSLLQIPRCRRGVDVIADVVLGVVEFLPDRVHFGGSAPFGVLVDPLAVR
jgi:hypothetical protein